jgi:spoIIIJ-associated protein
MTEDRIFEGRNLEEALGSAAETLGLSQEDLHYEMLDAGRRGLLGLGVKNVRIRVKPPIEAELQPDEPARKPKKSSGPKKSRAARKSPGPRNRSEAKKPRAAKKPPAGKKAPVRKKRPAAPKPPAEPADAAVVQDVEKTIVTMVEKMGLDLEVRAAPHDDGVNVQLEGPDEEMLVARNAELLAAFQFLLNRMSRRAWPGLGRINVVCDGHARPRDEELIAMARKVAKQVTRSGKTKKLHPMNAYERRLVHIAVREFPGLTSSSDGNGALKRVRISKVQNQI